MPSPPLVLEIMNESMPASKMGDYSRGSYIPNAISLHFRGVRVTEIIVFWMKSVWSVH